MSYLDGDPNKKLNAKQLIFGDSVIKGRKDLEALSDAGYSMKGGRKTIDAKAYRLKNTPNVKKYITDGQAEAAKRAHETVEDLLKELEEARGVGKAESSASGMVAATMGKAKLLGLDRLIVEIKDAKNLTPWSSITAGVDANGA